MLLNIFGEAERVLADLYPYRYLLSALGTGALLGLAVLFFRLGALSFVMRHRLPAVIAGAPLLVLAVLVGNYLLSPLWERSFLEEASPLEASMTAFGMEPTSGTTAMTGGRSSMPRVSRRGEFRGADEFHFGRGHALLIEDNGTATVRFENFSVRNGPDLYVYLSREESGRRVDESLNLGRLKATDGSFNYEIPAHVDVSAIRSVLVWCRQFSVLFAIAPLEAAS